MSLIQTPCWKCDLCGWTWVRVEGRRKPPQCVSHKCRTRRWDSGGSKAPRSVVVPMAREIPEIIPDRTGSTTQDLRDIAAGRPKGPQAERSLQMEPEIDEDGPPDRCPYVGYGRDTGEEYRCSLPMHSPKVRHVKGEAVG